MYVKHRPDNSAFDLFRNGRLALCEVEKSGMRIDMDYVNKQIKWIGKRDKELTDKLQSTKTWKKWQKRFGTQAKLGNRGQLHQVLTKDLGIYIPPKMDHGEEKESTDKDVLADIDHPFVIDYVRRNGLNVCKSVWLDALLRESVDNYLHPSFNLNIAISYRSSSSNPNVQNWPVRNEELKSIVRGSIISRFGKKGKISETDFKSIEVVVGTAYHKDKQMIKYLSDKNPDGSFKYDMHRDMAMECFMLSRPELVSDIARYCAKNMFVFPAFYGSYYPQMARPLWRAIGRFDLRIKLEGDVKEATGRSLKRHLEKRGITGLGACDPKQDPKEGTFEYHIKEVERRFWKERFKDYDSWKQEWYEQYLETCGFKTHTGFAFNGYFKRNAVLNYPIQGSAFHCLLWCLIRIVRELKKNKMKSCIIGQIHDSMLADVHVDEEDHYMEIVNRVTMVDLPRHYPWLNIVPIAAETEMSGPGESWLMKKKHKAA